MKWRKPVAGEVGMGCQFISASMLADDLELDGKKAIGVKDFEPEFEGCGIYFEVQLGPPTRQYGVQHPNPNALDRFNQKSFTTSELVDAGFEIC